MSVNAPAPVIGTRRMPDSDAIKKQRAVTKFQFMALVVFIIALAIGLIVWVFFLAIIQDAVPAQLLPGANLAIVLAPVLAAATGVERMLETLFNIIEGNWKSMVAYLGRGLRWLNSVEVEVDASRQWLADVSTRYGEEMSLLQMKEGMSVADLSQEMLDKISSARAMLDLAEKRLATAENNLAAAVTSDGYSNAKAAASIVLGLVIGVIVAAMGQLQMFAMLGIGSVPARVDVFITGLVIGSGSYPVHSLLGILQQTKDTLDGAKSYLNQAGTKKPAEAQPAAVAPTEKQ